MSEIFTDAFERVNFIVVPTGDDDRATNVLYRNDPNTIHAIDNTATIAEVRTAIAFLEICFVR